MKSARGAIDPISLVVIGVVALTLGGWRPLDMFKKKPDTAQLTQLQADLAKAQLDAEKARQDKDAAVAAERAKLEAQVRSAQQDNLGAETALKKVPASHQTPEVKLAARMTQRVSLKLATAIGRLPQDQQEAMVELVEQALSDKQAEVDEANRKLAQMDSDFKAITAERESLKAEIPKLTQRAVNAEETAKATQAEVTAKTNEVKEQANRLFASQMENGSLWSNLKRGLLIIGALWAFWVFGIPGIVKHLSSGNPLKGLLRDVNGYCLNPLTYHDARQKLSELIKPQS